MGKHPEVRLKTGLRFAEKPDAFDRMLADQGNTSIEGWRDRIAAQIGEIGEPQAQFRISMHLGRHLASLATRCAAMNGISREAWIRKVIAEAIEVELQIPADVLIAEAMRGIHPRNTKARLQGDA